MSRPNEINWTLEMVVDLLRLRREGLSERAIARRMGLSHGTVHGKLFRLANGNKRTGKASERVAPAKINWEHMRKSDLVAALATRAKAAAHKALSGVIHS